MRPKFKVGEVVIIQCGNYPEVNGEGTVLGVREPGFNETGFKAFKGFSYRLDKPYEILGRAGDHYGEPCLRKKHQPGELSFDNLMHSLSSPKLITAG